MRITDTHMHIVPGVDDGSQSLTESVELIERAVAQGVGTIIATPHSWGIDTCGPEYMLSRFRALEETIRERQIPVRLHLGCEMLAYVHTVDDCIRKLKEGRYPTLAGSRCVLTEFDPQETPESMEYCIRRIAAAGYVPVIAHAERYRRIAVPDIRALKAIGAMIQINAYSISDEKDDRIRRLANDCLSERLVDCIGSDAHRLDHRPPVIRNGIAALIERYTEDYAERVAMLDPQQILSGKEEKRAQI